MGDLLLFWLKAKPICLKELDKVLPFCVISILGGLITSPIHAQVIPDTTLGAESSTIDDVVINGIPSEKISGGAIRETLLFHSFQEFNIDEGHGAYFANPDNINTIFSRVTGRNPSNLLGTLGVLGSADLVFLNPNGVLFGPNFQLDIEGSFTTTTSSGVIFPNGETFSSIKSEVPSLIENNLVAPIGLIFEGQTSAPIVSQGNLSTGDNLTLLAHTITVQNELSAGNDLTLQAEDTVKIEDSIDEAFVAIAGNNLSITGQNQVDIFALNHPQSILASGGDMTLRSATPVVGDAHYAVGGNFRIENLVGQLAPLISEVDPIIATANDVELGGYTGTSLHILAGGQVTITGDVEITGADAAATSIGPNAPAPFNQANFRDILLSDGETTVSIDGSAQPTLDIRAGIDWETLLGTLPGDANLFTLPNPNPTFGTTATSADINLKGNIQISAPDGLAYLSNQYFPNASLNGGDIQINDIITENIFRGGNVTIDSRDDLTVLGRINSRAFFDNAGDIFIIAQDNVSLLNDIDDNNDFITDARGFDNNGGDITIITGSLLVKDGSQIQSTTFGSGQAGDITITARDRVDLDGLGILGTPSNIVSGIRPNATGDGGRIEVSAGIVSLTNGGTIIAQSLGEGNLGDINITATEAVILDEINIPFTRRSAIVSEITRNATGSTGDIEISTPRLSVTNGALVSTLIRGTGNAGDIVIKDAESISLSSDNGEISNILSLVEFNSTGNTGNIVIENTDTLLVDDGARIASTIRDNGSTGNTGSVNINVRNLISLDNQATIFSTIDTGSLGNSAGVQISTDSLRVNGGAQILSGNQGSRGTAGNILIIANDSIILGGIGEDGIPSSIASGLGPNMITGQGGNIEILTPVLELTNGAAIDSSTFGGGNAGNIFIRESERVSLDGVNSRPTLLRSSVAPGAVGNAGSIDVETSSFTVTNGAVVLSATNGQGDAGDITIIAQDQVVFDGQAVISLEEFATDLPDLILPDLYAFTGLEPNSAILVGVSSAASFVGPNATGEAGDITISVLNGSLAVNNGAVLGASTSGQGDGGNITLIASDNITLSGQGPNELSSVINSGGNFGTQSTGGSINLSAMTVSLDDGAQLSVTNEGQGNAGDININETWVVQLDEQSEILSQSTSGNGGNINFRRIDLLTLRQNSTVSTEAGLNSVGGGGNGGNINAEIDFIFAVPSENSDIIANAFDGNGGNILIVTEGISGLEFRPELTQFSDITASSQLGVDGTVTIDTPGIDFARGFNPLPDAPRGTDITDSCDVSDNQDAVELFDIGQGGSVAGPEDTLTTENFVEAPWLSIPSSTRETPDSVFITPHPNIGPTSQDITISVARSLSRQLITKCQQP